MARAVSPAEIKNHYSDPDRVAFYREAAAALGLWRSEEAVFTRVFRPGDALLDVGCGAGRLSLALWELGYRQVLGVDFARPMIETARLLAAKLEYVTPFRVGDVTRLGFEAGAFDGAIWSANGIADLPDDEARRAALRELRRVVRFGGALVLTTPAEWPAREIAVALAASGWEVSETRLRREIADEPPEVAAFCGECRFWVATAA